MSFAKQVKTALSAVNDKLNKCDESISASWDREFGFYLVYPSFISNLVEVFEDRPLSTTLPILFVTNIISVVYINFVFCALPLGGVPMFSLESMYFHFLTVLTSWSYFKTIVTDPGSIPVGYDPKTIFPDFDDESLRSHGLLRVCKNENVYKPLRAHYCGALKRNVLKMDHYCAWSAGAVGFYNYKHFLLFLAYASAGNIISLELTSAILFRSHSAIPIAKVFLLSQAFVLSGALTAVLCPFLLFHCWLAATNTTTIEFCERRTRKDKRSYSVSFASNLKEIFGSNPLLWTVPMDSTPGDGLQFLSVQKTTAAGESIINRLRIGFWNLVT
jgi:palmitoyltransferase ZDHHC2/15/20